MILFKNIYSSSPRTPPFQSQGQNLRKQKSGSTKSYKSQMKTLKEFGKTIG